MQEKDILRAELKSLKFSSMDTAKMMLMYLRVIETSNKIPTVYDLLDFSRMMTIDEPEKLIQESFTKGLPEWYKQWGWPCFSWELLSNKYGAAAKHNRDGKVSHFVVYLPPPQKLPEEKPDKDYALVSSLANLKEKENNNENSNESCEKS